MLDISKVQYAKVSKNWRFSRRLGRTPPHPFANSVALTSHMRLKAGIEGVAGLRVLGDISEKP